jgi:hypothetical protein
MSAVTAFQHVAEACVAALKAAPALAGGHIKANPTRPWPKEVAQCVAVRLSGASRVGGDACGDHWQLTIEAECEARGETGVDPADAVDALLASVAGRLGAADLSLAGVVQREPEGTVAWQFDVADTPVAQASYQFAVLVHTAPEALTPSAP